MTRWTRTVFELAFATITLTGCQDPGVVERHLRQQIRQEIPIGSDKTQVIAFLRRNDIEDFFYHEKTRTLYAKIRHVAAWRLAFETQIRLQFYFDENEKLIAYKAEQAVVGF
jgi:hypothetical protein